MFKKAGIGGAIGALLGCHLGIAGTILGIGVATGAAIPFAIVGGIVGGILGFKRKKKNNWIAGTVLIFLLLMTVPLAIYCGGNTSVLYENHVDLSK